MPRTRKLPEGLWKRGDTYYARFRANGRMVRKRLSTVFDTACELLRDLRSRADKADFQLIDNDFGFAELKIEFLRWAKQTKRPRVAKGYEADLKRFDEYCSVRSIRQVDHAYVAGYREWRLARGVVTKHKGKGGQMVDKRRDVTARTVNREVGTLVNMLSKGVLWKRIGSNPIENTSPLPHDSPKKCRRALTVVEVEALFRESPDYLRPVWRMLLTTGMRKNELTTLDFDDIDFERRTVTIRAEHAKNHREREITLDDQMVSMLAKLHGEAPYRMPQPAATAKQTEQQAKRFSRDRVFVTQANTPWTNNLLLRFYACCKRAGIDDAVRGGSVDIHSLRVTVTTLMLENGAAPKAVQEILGHRTLQMTMDVYAKAREHSKRAAVGALPFATVQQPAHLIAFPVQNAHTVRTSNSDSSQTDVTQATA